MTGEVDKVRLVYTRFVSVGFQEVVSRPLAPLEDELVADDGESERVQAGYEFEPTPGRHPRVAAAPLRRGPRVRRAARTPPRPSTPPASGP